MFYDVCDPIGDQVIIICVVGNKRCNFRFDHLKNNNNISLRDSAQGGSVSYAHAHPGENEPFWFLFYIYLFVNKKPKFDSVFVFCHFCLHPLQNAVKEEENPKEKSELQPFFPL